MQRLGHPGPLAHGLQVLSFTAAGAGLFPHVIGEKLIGFIEVNAKFLKGVYAGDTLYPALTITELTRSGRPASSPCARRCTTRNPNSFSRRDRYLMKL